MNVNHRVLAKACGVSTATISRALGDSPHVRQSVREMVLAKASELGYVPDPRLARLSRLRWEKGRKPESVIIAVLCDRFTSQRPEKFDALCTEAKRIGYTIELIELEKVRKSGKNLGKELYHRGIQGVLVNLHDPHALPDIDWRNFCVVMVGEELPSLPFYRVSTDWRQAFDILCNKVAQSGMKRVGFALVQYVGIELNRMMLAEALLHREELTVIGAADIPLFRYDPSDPAIKSAFMKWVKNHSLQCVVINERRPEDWLEGTKQNVRVLHITMATQQINTGRSGIDIQLGGRISSALRVLHELLSTRRKGFAPQPTRTLYPVLWHGDFPSKI